MPVLEIVTFRLKEGSDVEVFLEAAKATFPFAAGLSGFGNRRLTVDDEGLWTDVVEWDSLANAKSAAEAFMEAPVVGPFVQMIDLSTATMRHANIHLKD